MENHTMQQILLQPVNPQDLRAEDLQDLADAIRQLDHDYEVKIAYHDQIGHRVTWVEALTIWLPAVIDSAALAAIIAQSIAWARRRFKKEESEQAENDNVQYRPKSVTILGPNGEVLKSIKIRNPNQELEDDTVEAAKSPLHRRPPIR